MLGVVGLKGNVEYGLVLLKLLGVDLSCVVGLCCFIGIEMVTVTAFIKLCLWLMWIQPWNIVKYSSLSFLSIFSLHFPSLLYFWSLYYISGPTKCYIIVFIFPNLWYWEKRRGSWPIFFYEYKWSLVVRPYFSIYESMISYNTAHTGW